MKDLKDLGLVAPSSTPDSEQLCKERAYMMLASTLIELARGDRGDARDMQLAVEWAAELVEAITDYAVVRARMGT
jgi:hypothetical protein